jgi:hypothetical protein
LALSAAVNGDLIFTIPLSVSFAVHGHTGALLLGGWGRRLR